MGYHSSGGVIFHDRECAAGCTTTVDDTKRPNTEREILSWYVRKELDGQGYIILLPIERSHRRNNIPPIRQNLSRKQRLPIKPNKIRIADARRLEDWRGCGKDERRKKGV